MINAKFMSVLAIAAFSLVACGKDEMKDSATMETGDTAAVSAEKVADKPAGTMPAAGANPMVGGAEMYPTKDIVDNAMNSADHTTLVTAVKAAGLVETLKGTGPFTVFAPTNEAFGKLPAGAVETLVKPENKEKLTGILTYHVVPGTYDAAMLADEIGKGNGKATLKTAAGGTLTVMMEGADVVVADAAGGKAKVTIADVRQSNGVIHVIDTVLMP